MYFQSDQPLAVLCAYGHLDQVLAGLFTDLFTSE